jgi:hypothetical protein
MTATGPQGRTTHTDTDDERIHERNPSAIAPTREQTHSRHHRSTTAGQAQGKKSPRTPTQSGHHGQTSYVLRTTYLLPVPVPVVHVLSSSLVVYYQLPIVRPDVLSPRDASTGYVSETQPTNNKPTPENSTRGQLCFERLRGGACGVCALSACRGGTSSQLKKSCLTRGTLPEFPSGCSPDAPGRPCSAARAPGCVPFGRERSKLSRPSHTRESLGARIDGGPHTR